MEFVEINLSRSLKLKNRLANRLARLDSLIIAHNSSVKDNSEFDVRELYKRRMLLAEQLVQLKVDISQANQVVQKQIYEIAECKALCKTLNQVNTAHGPHTSGYGEAIQNLEAQFRQVDIKREVAKVEKEIDQIQDKLDSFNYQTKIQVPQILLEPVADF